MTILKVATCFWQPNDKSQPFSRCYDESWVEKLYRGFARNLTVPFNFYCFTDRDYVFKEPIVQLSLTGVPDYGCMIRPFSLHGPKIIVGLDTVVVRNVDHLARYCLGAYGSSRIALPVDPYDPLRSINGVALVPSGNVQIGNEWNGENDMAWLRRFPWTRIDDCWPGHVVSLKAHDVRRKGLQDARIVYFHGDPKPHQLGHLDWIREHWR